MRKTKTGLPPGSLVHIGEHSSDKVSIHLFDYSLEHLEESKISELTDYTKYSKNDSVTWINVNGIHDSKIIESFSNQFNIHRLVLEDIMDTGHRPKAEEYDDNLFFTLKMLKFDEKKEEVVHEQVSFILKDGLVISFQEIEGDVFDPIRERMRAAKGKVREKKSDYLVYLLIDIIIDNYFTTIEKIGTRIEDLEEIVLENPPKDFLLQIQKLKKELTLVRRSVFPLREAIGFMEKGESNFISEDTLKYFRDTYDHTLSIIDTVETNKDLLGTLKDLYLSNLSNKMNNTMKVLTVMASIFIPLTFIAGVYGMNFKYMPELESPYGYIGVWGVMIFVTIGMVWYFKKKEYL